MIKTQEVDSIVLGAAENMAKDLGFTIAGPAKDLLLRDSFTKLNKANEDGAIETRRAEIERKTAALVAFIAFESLGKDEPGREITDQQMLLGLSAFCRLFPDFFPFCTPRDTDGDPE
jgi:hypothetical protein